MMLLLLFPQCLLTRLTFQYVGQVVAAGANPVQITRGIDKTVVALVKELKNLAKDVSDILSFKRIINNDKCSYGGDA